MNTNNISQLIKDAGIEIKVSKQDILDLVLDNIEEDLKAKLDQLLNDREALREDTEAEQIAVCNKYAHKASKDPKVKKLKKALEEFHGVAFTLFWCVPWSNSDFRTLILAPVEMWGDVGPEKLGDFPLTAGTSNNKEVTLKQLRLSTEPEMVALCVADDELVNQYRLLSRQLKELTHGGKKVKLAIIRDVLSSTEEGQALLDALDARTGAQVLKQLKG